MDDCFDLYVVADITSVQSEVHLSLPLFGGLKVKELVEWEVCFKSECKMGRDIGCTKLYTDYLCKLFVNDCRTLTATALQRKEYFARCT